jgi:hypothetical protein
VIQVILELLHGDPPRSLPFFRDSVARKYILVFADLLHELIAPILEILLIRFGNAKLGVREDRNEDQQNEHNDEKPLLLPDLERLVLN